MAGAQVISERHHATEIARQPANGHLAESPPHAGAQNVSAAARRTDDDQRITVFHRVEGPLRTGNHSIVYGDSYAGFREVEHLYDVRQQGAVGTFYGFVVDLYFHFTLNYYCGKYKGGNGWGEKQDTRTIPTAV